VRYYANILEVSLRCWWCLVEYIFALLFGSILSKTFLDFVISPEWTSLFGIVCALIRTLVVLILLWFRYHHLIENPPKGLPSRITISKIKMSWTSFVVCLFHFADLFLMLGVQWWTGRWVFSFANYLEDSQLELYKVSNFLIFTPILEELVFRGILTYILATRIQHKGKCILFSNLIFGLFHLVNLFGSSYSFWYVLLQVFLGMEIGLFYGCQFLLSQNIWECIILHMVNNITSSFLPATTLEFADPLITVSLLQTVIVYGFLLWNRRHLLLW